MAVRCVDGHAFFFQAEDGIRDKLVTGVQTCALPISQGVVFIGMLDEAIAELQKTLAISPREDNALRRIAETRTYQGRSEEHTSELQSLAYLVCRLLLEKKKNSKSRNIQHSHMPPRQ